MAFNIKRQSAPVDDAGTTNDTTSSSTDCNCTNGTVVATQNWVSRVLDRIWNWRTVFQTGALQVSGSVECAGVIANQVHTDELMTQKITLVDQNGKPIVLTIEDGKLSIQQTYAGVFVYPGNGDLDIKGFRYTPGVPIIDHFSGVSPKLVLSNFIPFTDNEYTAYDGANCYKLCSSDGIDELVGKTLMVTCADTKKITELHICDEQMRLLKVIEVPGDDVQRVTINLPIISSGGVDETDTIVQLPSISSCTCCSNGTHLPHPPPLFNPMYNPVISPVPLNPNLFDDDFTVEEDEANGCDCGPTWIVIGQDDGESGTTVIENETRYQTIVTDNYTNIVLKRSDFKTDQKQFIVFKTASL